MFKNPQLSSDKLSFSEGYSAQSSSTQLFLAPNSLLPYSQMPNSQSSVSPDNIFFCQKMVKFSKFFEFCRKIDEIVDVCVFRVFAKIDEFVDVEFVDGDCNTVILPV